MELALAKEGGRIEALPRALLQLDADTDYHLSRVIGQMLGFNLYKKVIADKVSTVKIRRLFKKRIPSLDAVWREVSWLYDLMLR